MHFHCFCSLRFLPKNFSMFPSSCIVVSNYGLFMYMGAILFRRGRIIFRPSAVFLTAEKPPAGEIISPGGDLFRGRTYFGTPATGIRPQYYRADRQLTLKVVQQFAYGRYALPVMIFFSRCTKNVNQPRTSLQYPCHTATYPHGKLAK